MCERGPEARRASRSRPAGPRRGRARRDRAAAARRAGTRPACSRYVSSQSGRGAGNARRRRRRGARRGTRARRPDPRPRAARPGSGGRRRARARARRTRTAEPPRGGAARARAGARPRARSPRRQAGGAASARPTRHRRSGPCKSQPSSTSIRDGSTGATLLWPAGRAVVAEASHRRRACGDRRVCWSASAAIGRSQPRIGHELTPAARRDLHARSGLHVARPDRPRRRDGAEARRQGLLARARALERPAARQGVAHAPREAGGRRRDDRGDRRRLLRQHHRRAERDLHAGRRARQRAGEPGARASASPRTARSRPIASPSPGSGRGTVSAARCR